MATVTGITKQRALQIENASIASGEINPATGHLLLRTVGGSISDAGQVVPDYAVKPVANRTVRDALTSFSGMLVYRQDIDRVEQKLASGWVPVTPSEITVWRIVESDILMSNQNTLGMFPAGAERNAFSGSLVKSANNTKLVIDLSVSLNLGSGAIQNVLAGMRVNSTNYTIVSRDFYAAPYRATLTARRAIADIPAGNVTFDPIVATSLASSLEMRALGDTLSYTVREV